MKVLMSKYHIWSIPMVWNTMSDQVNGNINAIHDDHLESTEFVGHFCPFNLEELELKLCKIIDYHEKVDDCRPWWRQAEGDTKYTKPTATTPAKPMGLNQQLRIKFKTEKYGWVDRYGVQLARLQYHTYSWEYSLIIPCRYWEFQLWHIGR